MSIFEQEVREKGRIAAGAHHKKRRGRGCRLPSDCLTPGQLRRLSGPVVTYRLDGPMRCQELLALPEDLRRAYVAHLRDGFRVSARMLGRMLAVPEAEAGALMKALGVPPGTPDDEAQRRWAAFCGEEDGHAGM